MINREIKFRAWDLDAADKIYSWEEIRNNFHEHLSHERIAVMQYIGIKDKNGVEIYEGDICRVLYTDWPSKMHDDPRTIEQYLIDISTIMDVEYDDVSFYFVRHNNEHKHYNSTWVGKHGRIEVIGNIYEHPHLLTTHP